MKHTFLALSVAAAMTGFASTASAVTVNFTDEESPGVSCCGLMASGAYAAYGLTVDNVYWYADSRDTFDGEGVSIYEAPTATITFAAVSPTVGFTDGSKQGCAVAAAAVMQNKVLAKRLPDHASIFSAEAQAIMLALDIIKQSPNQRFLILSDSLSCVEAIKNRHLQNLLIVKILECLHQQLRSNRSITFVWVPSHIGIAGNTAADAMPYH